MAKAESLLVGLTSVDPNKYGNWDGTNGCWGCELDVDNVGHILHGLDYTVSELRTAHATGEAILWALNDASDRCQPGDIFVFYYSGHGGQQPDFDGDELDGKDETLVAYDREVTDDELNEIWPKFKAGVNIVMMSDSCNSGTNYRLRGAQPDPTPVEPISDESTASRMKAQMIHMGGCRDGSTSSGYLSGGLFTQALCNVWDGGSFSGDYVAFHQQIKDAVSGQEIRYNEYGPVTDEFRSADPFAVVTPAPVTT